jgi:hypothetical protein
MAKITTTLYGDLALIPFQAESTMVETWEFYTDVSIARDLSEERIQGRSKPRVVYNYKIPLSSTKAQESFNTEFGGLRIDNAIPVWSDVQYVGLVAAGATSISCNTELYDLRENSLAMLFNCGNWQIIEINSIDTSSITLTAGVTLEINKAYLIPVRKGWVRGAISRNVSGYSASTSINYVVDDNPYLEAEVPDQYLSNDIYFEPLLKDSETLNTSLNQQQTIVDQVVGPVARFTDTTRPQQIKPFYSILENRQQIVNFKKFLFRRAGKYRPFWLPSFENDLRLLSTGTISTTITISSDSFIAYASQRTHIAIHANEAWHARAVSNPIQLDADRVQLTLSSALNLPADKIVCISYLGLYRFDSDKIDLTWQSGIVKTTVPIIEISL